MSHNNLSEHCIYLNSKQTWKLNDFELAINFSNLNRENLRQIYEFKNKKSITPEEEAEVMGGSKIKFDLDLIYKQSPHSIDAYGWAMLVINLLPTNNQPKGLYNNSYSAIDHTLDGLDSGEYVDQLELFLSKDPSLRPTLKFALGMRLFSGMTNNLTDNSIDSRSNDKESQDNSDQFDIFKISNLDELDENFNALTDFLGESIQNEKKKRKSSNPFINEKLIDFFLSPFMFFSSQFRAKILPSILIPRENLSETKNFKFNANNFYFLFYKNFLKNEQKINIDLKNGGKEDDENMSWVPEPFLDSDKYKAFVLPRILNLFSIHSAQIRIGILQYFPFYVSQINDMDTLQYDILPEVNLKNNYFTNKH